MNNAEVVNKYIAALQHYDYETAATLMHPDIRVHYPQSGETVLGRDNYKAMFEAWPDAPSMEPGRSTYDETVVQVPSSLPFGRTTTTVVGSGDTCVKEGTITYPNGEVWNFVSIIRVEEGLVKEETSYFAEPFEPADWRIPYCEPVE